ncbi:hypothetical protein ACNFJ7_03485 [Sphingomonas sp. HT-1]|uniref:hypothetical protein n=1 Tax=unclassified Sphingomonas TaxID=196159 RepID=UPI00031DA175|nr:MULTISPECIES: hypothetical protein [unclassified Sphingomonas]
MRGNSLIVTILAIIGGIVVLGWVLELAFNLIGTLVLIGLAVVFYLFVQKLVGKGR